jgi:multiple sugar transport system substrate-binding protein
MQKGLAWALLAGSVALAGCGGGTTGGKDQAAQNQGAKPDNSKPVELNIWGGYPEMDPLYKKVAEEFKQTHPNVTVNVTSYPLRDYEKKLAAALPSDSGPDILHGGPSSLGRYLDADMLVPAPKELGDYVKGKAFGPFEVEHASYKDQVFGIPFFKGQSALFYNLDDFKAAGIAEPPKTMDEVVADARKLAKSTGGNLEHAGLSLRLTGGGSGLGEKFWILMEQRGGSIVTKSKSGKYHNGYNNDAGRQTLQMYIDLVHKDMADDPKLKHDAEAFELGLASMFFRESWVVGDIEKKAPQLHYATAKMPVAAISLPEMLYVPKASKNGALAWEYIKLLTSEKYQKVLLDEVGWLPMRKDADYADVLKKHPGFAGFMVNDPNYRYFSPPTDLKEFDEIETKFATRLEKAYADASLKDNPAGIAKVIQEAADETDAILKAAGVYGND